MSYLGCGGISMSSSLKASSLPLAVSKSSYAMWFSVNSANPAWFWRDRAMWSSWQQFRHLYCCLVCKMLVRNNSVLVKLPLPFCFSLVQLREAIIMVDQCIYLVIAVLIQNCKVIIRKPVIQVGQQCTQKWFVDLARILLNACIFWFHLKNGRMFIQVVRQVP